LIILNKHQTKISGSQLIDLMRINHQKDILPGGRRGLVGSHMIKLRRLLHGVMNLTDIINYCFTNDFSKVLKEVESSDTATISKPDYYTVSNLSKTS